MDAEVSARSSLSAGEASVSRNVPTAPQQGAAPDRRQFGSLCSVSALFKVGRDWAAAGELGRSAAARGVAEYATWTKPDILIPMLKTALITLAGTVLGSVVGTALYLFTLNFMARLSWAPEFPGETPEKLSGIGWMVAFFAIGISLGIGTGAGIGLLLAQHRKAAGVVNIITGVCTPALALVLLREGFPSLAYFAHSLMDKSGAWIYYGSNLIMWVVILLWWGTRLITRNSWSKS